MTESDGSLYYLLLLIALPFSFQSNWILFVNKFKSQSQNFPYDVAKCINSKHLPTARRLLQLCTPLAPTLHTPHVIPVTCRATT